MWGLKYLMKEYIEDRAQNIGKYMVETGATVRDCAKEFGVSKSTVHKDVTERLYKVNRQLHQGVSKVLEKNLAERHIRGGSATKQRFLSQHVES